MGNPIVDLPEEPLEIFQDPISGFGSVQQTRTPLTRNGPDTTIVPNLQQLWQYRPSVPGACCTGRLECDEFGFLGQIFGRSRGADLTRRRGTDLSLCTWVSVGRLVEHPKVA